MQRVVGSPLIQERVQTRNAKEISQPAPESTDFIAPTSKVAIGYGKVGNLHGQTVGTFDDGKKSIQKLKITPSSGCDCSGTQKCMIATATLVMNYNVKVKITMPPMPDGLSACEQRQVNAFLKNVLRPHEEEHKRLLESYNGSTQHQIKALGCGRSEAKSNLDTEADTIQSGEAQAREQKARDASDAIDPFLRAVDFTDCDK